jgi:hypothetical protein
MGRKTLYDSVCRISLSNYYSLETFKTEALKEVALPALWPERTAIGFDRVEAF